MFAFWHHSLSDSRQAFRVWFGLHRHRRAAREDGEGPQPERWERRQDPLFQSAEGAEQEAAHLEDRRQRRGEQPRGTRGAEQR